MGESLVKDTLKDPDSAKFDSFFRDFGENSGYVCGYVNAKNSYGAYTGKNHIMCGLRSKMERSIIMDQSSLLMTKTRRKLIPMSQSVKGTDVP